MQESIHRIVKPGMDFCKAYVLLSPPFTNFIALLYSFLQFYVLLVSSHPQQHTVLEMRPHQSRAGWDNPLPWPAAVLGLIHPVIWLAFLAARAHCWLIFNLPSNQMPRSLSMGLLSSLSSLRLPCPQAEACWSSHDWWLPSPLVFKDLSARPLWPWGSQQLLPI